MSTDTASENSFARRKSDREPASAVSADAPEDADFTSDEADAGEDSLAIDDFDDGTPEDEDFSEPSAADEWDANEDVNAAVREREIEAARAAGSVSDDGRPHRRRRRDEPLPPGYTVLPPRPRSRAPWIVAVVLLVLAVGAAAYLDWYLWNTSDQWEQRADDLTEVNYGLGEQLATEQQTASQLRSEIDLLTQQLATSNQTVLDLSADKANAVDESEFYLQQIDQLNADLSTSISVATALNRCIDGQQQLVGYLLEAELYDEAELNAFRISVQELCAQAEAANSRQQGTAGQ